MAYSLFLFLLITFSTLNSCCFLQFFFIKRSNNFFTNEMVNSICPQNCIFKFFNYKNVFRTIWSIFFSKNVFVFSYSYVITNFRFGISVITINTLNFVLWYALLYSSIISSNLHYTHILILKPCTYVIFQGSNKSFSNSRFSFILC